MIRFKMACWSSKLSAPWICFQEKVFHYLCLFAYNPQVDFIFPTVDHTFVHELVIYYFLWKMVLASELEFLP